MRQILLALCGVVFASVVQAACVVTGSAQFVDGSDPHCWPALNKDKCQHYMAGEGTTVGAVQVDVDDAKKFGKQTMNFASQRACEGKPNCGPYVGEFKSQAVCDGKPVQDMPGGEYRGLTAEKARQILEYNNRQLEKMAESGEARGKKPNAKGKGKLWGND
jgi:hypothetical protein